MRTASRVGKIAFFSVAALVAATRVSFAAPTPSLALTQEDFSWDTDTDTNSTVGQALYTNTGGDTYLNIVDSANNWVVQNEFVPAGQTVSSSFFLSNATDGVNDTTLTYTQSVSAAPVTAFSYNSLNSTTTTLGDTNFDYEGAANDTSFDPTGAEDPAGGFKPAAPVPGQVAFTLGGQTLTIVYRPGVPNIQAADNQCVPASLANGLQWLQITRGLGVTQTNTTGLKGDATLVGVMDTDTNRTVASRTSGRGVTAASQVDGLLQYLDDQNLTNVKVKHEGFASAANRSVTSSGRTSTSTAVATIVTFQFIIDELQAGAAVQVWESWANGAHAMEVTGAGYALGVPWITFTSDLLQTPQDNGFLGGLIPPDSFGTNQVNFSYLGQPTAAGQLRFLNEAGKPVLTFAVAEEVPEPASLMLLGASSLMLLRRRRA